MSLEAVFSTSVTPSLNARTRARHCKRPSRATRASGWYTRRFASLASLAQVSIGPSYRGRRAVIAVIFVYRCLRTPNRPLSLHTPRFTLHASHFTLQISTFPATPRLMSDKGSTGTSATMTTRRGRTEEEAILDEGPPYTLLRDVGCRYGRGGPSRSNGRRDSYWHNDEDRARTPRACDVRHCETLDELITTLLQKAVPVSEFASPDRLLAEACRKQYRAQQRALKMAGLATCPACDRIVFPQFDESCCAAARM